MAKCDNLIIHVALTKHQLLRPSIKGLRIRKGRGRQKINKTLPILESKNEIA